MRHEYVIVSKYLASSDSQQTLVPPDPRPGWRVRDSYVFRTMTTGNNCNNSTSQYDTNQLVVLWELPILEVNE